MAWYQFSRGGIRMPIGTRPPHQSVAFNVQSVRSSIARSASQLNKERNSLGTRGFARVDVTDVCRDPRDDTDSFFVTFSDVDEEMSARMRVIVEGLVRSAQELDYVR